MKLVYQYFRLTLITFPLYALIVDAAKANTYTSFHKGCDTIESQYDCDTALNAYDWQLKNQFNLLAKKSDISVYIHESDNGYEKGYTFFYYKRNNKVFNSLNWINIISSDSIAFGKSDNKIVGLLNTNSLKNSVEKLCNYPSDPYSHISHSHILVIEINIKGKRFFYKFCSSKFSFYPSSKFKYIKYLVDVLNKIEKKLPIN